MTFSDLEVRQNIGVIPCVFIRMSKESASSFGTVGRLGSDAQSGEALQDVRCPLNMIVRPNGSTKTVASGEFAVASLASFFVYK